MRIQPLRPNPILALACILVVVLFLLDAAVPEAHFWARYLLPLVVVFLWGRRGDIYIVAALTGVLVAAGCWFDQPLALGRFLANYLLPIITLWGVAWLLAQRQLLLQLLARREQDLDTEVKARTAALAAREEQLAKIFSASPGGISITRQSDGCILDANDTYLAMLGYTRDQLIGHTLVDLGILGAASRAGVAAAIHAAGSLHGIDLQLTNAHGEPVDVLCSFEEVEFAGAPCYLGLIMDIAKRKRLEEALAAGEARLQAANAELEQRVAARTADLEAALAELQRAGQIKDEFMAMISHELRTPLMGVLSLSEMLADQAAGPLNARQVTYVQGIRQSGDRLLNVINGIIGYTHLLAGQVELRAEPCSLAYLLDIGVASQQRKAAAKDQAIAVAVEPPDLAVTADATAITEVLKRLLDNAVKFTPQGGQIGLEAHTGASPETVDLTVWDTGIGIPLEQQPHLFAPFNQVDQTLARSYEGLGIGLASAHQLATLLGGRIAVQSEPSQGTRFTVTLPVTPPVALPAVSV